MRSERSGKLYKLLKGFSNAMLITHTASNGLHARPLAVADLQPDGEIYFSTSLDSAKVAEIEQNPDVVVTFQGKSEFAAVAGTARVVRDRALIDKLWSEAWRLWFPGGKDDPALCLLAIEPNSGEYWDNSGLKALKYFVKGTAAYFKGERVGTDDVHQHAKLDLK